VSEEERKLSRVTQKIDKKPTPMDSTKDHFDQQQPMSPGAAAKAQQLRGHSSATAAELREFLGQLKGRSPQEVMGIVAQSSLFRGITTATIACGVLMLVFTIGPYIIYGGPSARARQNAVAVTVQPATNDTPAKQSTDTAPNDPVKPDLAKAAQAMGIGETAEAAPDKNPLDSKLDNLLDGIE
jgi:hypothetical protein